MANKYYVGDIGTDIIVDCGQSISDATIKQIKYKKPDGTIGYWEADIYQNNYLKYTTEENDWDQHGVWYVNAYVEMTAWKGRGETDRFTLDDPFC